MGKPRKDRRVPLSLSAEQVQWLAQVMLTLQRGADVRVLMRGKLAASTLRTLVRAKVRAASVPPPPSKPPATHCRHGHTFTERNTYTHPTKGTRRCRTCIRAGDARYQAKKLRNKGRREQVFPDSAV
jgi:hypothetical protein